MKSETVDFAEFEEEVKPITKFGVNTKAVGTTIEELEEGIYEDPNNFSGRNEEDSTIDMVEYMRLLDPKLEGYSDTRKNAVLSHKREIISKGATDQLEATRTMFKNFKNFQNTLYQILESIDTGYAILENVWEMIDGKLTINKLLPRHPGKFKFDQKGQTYLVVGETEQKVDDLHFPVLTYKEKYGNRYGKGKYQSLYWYWFIKKEGVKFWAYYVERFSNPLIDVEMPAQVLTEVQTAIDNFLSDITAAQSIKHPEGVKISFLESDGTASKDMFESFNDFLDKSIAISYLGQVDTSGVAKSSSSLARASVQDLIRKDIMLSDILFLETFINDWVIKPFIDQNWPDVEDYPKWKIIVNPIITAETIKILIEAGHKKIPMAWVSELFGIPIPKEGFEDDEYMIITDEVRSFSEDNRDLQANIYIKELKKIMEAS